MRQLASVVLATVCYYIGLDHLFYMLNRNAKRIITFHNVMPSNLLPEGKSIGLTDTEESFATKIKEVRKHFRISTDVMDQQSLTITFDDGYRNQFDIAKKILGADKAVIFASGGVVNNDNPLGALTVDLLMHWTELIPNGHYDLSQTLGEGNIIDASSDNRQLLWQKIIWPAFVKDSESKGKNLFEALDKAYPMDKVLSNCSEEYLRLRLTGFTSNEIDNIRESDWVVGWHTQEHFPLSALTTDEKRIEIAEMAPAETKKTILSYPYGETQSVDLECLKIAEEAGYIGAVSNLPDVTPLTGQYFLPRITLSDNKYLLHFELSGLKHFIRNKKLLPRFV